MKKNLERKLKEGFGSFNPAADGARAARMDDRARRDKNSPFGYYAEAFYALEEIRQAMIDFGFKYKKEHGGQNFKKVAIMIEKAQNEMLKAGR